MTKSLVFKILGVVFAITLLQLSFTADSQAQGYSGEGYVGGGWSGGFYYTVQPGDTLFAICRRFGIDPYELARINGIRNPNHIYKGQVLYIPASSGYCPTCWAKPQHPQPQPGHGQHGCGKDCYQQHHGQQGCGSNCYHQPVQWHGCGKDCYQQHHGQQGCGSNCYQQGYGYDYTGYYYDGSYPNYQRYSHTCGYNYNCY